MRCAKCPSRPLHTACRLVVTLRRLSGGTLTCVDCLVVLWLVVII